MGNIHVKDVVKFSLDARLLRVWQNTLSRSVKMTKLLSVLCVESHSNTRQTLYTTSKSNTVVTPQASLAIFVTSHHSMKRVLSGTRKESTQLELCNFLVKLHLFASFSNKCCVSITSHRLFFLLARCEISCTESVFRDDKIIQLWRQGSFALLRCFSNSNKSASFIFTTEKAASPLIVVEKQRASWSSSHGSVQIFQIMLALNCTLLWEFQFWIDFDDVQQ